MARIYSAYSVSVINTNETAYTATMDEAVNVTVVNHAATAQTYSLHLVSSGGSVSTANSFGAGLPIREKGNVASVANFTGIRLSAGDFIVINANSTDISLLVNGDGR